MIQGTCKDCKFWKEYSDQYSRKVAHECEEVDYSEKIQDQPGDSKAIFAFAPDDHGLVQALFTGPDFGCVNFKPKGE